LLPFVTSFLCFSAFFSAFFYRFRSLATRIPFKSSDSCVSLTDGTAHVCSIASFWLRQRHVPNHDRWKVVLLPGPRVDSGTQEPVRCAIDPRHHAGNPQATVFDD